MPWLLRQPLLFCFRIKWTQPCVIPPSFVRTFAAGTYIDKGSLKHITQSVWFKKKVADGKRRPYDERNEDELPSKGKLVISCKRKRLNHFESKTYGSFDAMSLASHSWKNRKYAGDHFTINATTGNTAWRYSDNPTRFTDFEISSQILKTLPILRIKRPTDIQNKMIPQLLAGKSVLCTAQTGCGKTLAYLLPTLQVILNQHRSVAGEVHNPHRKSPLALILVPNRELVYQLHKVLKILTSDTTIRFRSLGLPLKHRKEIHDDEYIDILVGTPGLVRRLIAVRKYNFDKVQMVVVDEVDTLLDYSFQGILRGIFRAMKLFTENVSDEYVSASNMVMKLEEMGFDLDEVAKAAEDSNDAGLFYEKLLDDTKILETSDQRRKLINSVFRCNHYEQLYLDSGVILSPPEEEKEEAIEEEKDEVYSLDMASQAEVELSASEHASISSNLSDSNDDTEYQKSTNQLTNDESEKYLFQEDLVTSSPAEVSENMSEDSVLDSEEDSHAVGEEDNVDNDLIVAGVDVNAVSREFVEEGLPNVVFEEALLPAERKKHHERILVRMLIEPEYTATSSSLVDIGDIRAELDDVDDDPGKRALMEITESIDDVPTNISDFRGIQFALIGAIRPIDLENTIGDFIPLSELVHISTNHAHRLLQNVSQKFIRVKVKDKTETLLNIIKTPGYFPPTIIFCVTTNTCKYIHLLLRENGIESAMINSRLSIKQRSENLEIFQSGFCDILVATDIISHGIDTTRAHRIINFNMTQEITDYVHRVGRVGRLGSKGGPLVISFISKPWEVEQLWNIEMAARNSAPLKNLTPSVSRRIDKPKHRVARKQLRAF